MPEGSSCPTFQLCKWTTSGAPNNILVAHCLPVLSIQLLCSLIPPWYIEFWRFPHPKYFPRLPLLDGGRKSWYIIYYYYWKNLELNIIIIVVAEGKCLHCIESKGFFSAGLDVSSFCWTDACMGCVMSLRLINVLEYGWCNKRREVFGRVLELVCANFGRLNWDNSALVLRLYSTDGWLRGEICIDLLSEFGILFERKKLWFWMSVCKTIVMSCSRHVTVGRIDSCKTS